MKKKAATKKKAPTKKAVKKSTGRHGRPTRYLKEYDLQAKKLCMLGYTNDDLAKFFEVATSTVDLWIRKHESFSGSVKEGREIADAEVAASLFHRATGYSHPEEHISNYQGEITKTPTVKHYPPDTAAAFIWLKNRRGQFWKDKQDVDHNVGINVHITGEDLKL